MEKKDKTVIQYTKEPAESRREIKRLKLQARKYEKIEEELAHSGQFYRTLFENSGTAGHAGKTGRSATGHQRHGPSICPQNDSRSCLRF